MKFENRNDMNYQSNPGLSIAMFADLPVFNLKVF